MTSLYPPFLHKTPKTSHLALNVNLSAIVHNFHFVESLIGSSVCIPVVKANAYGLGAEQVSQELASHGAKGFFVAAPEEGLRLRRVLPDIPIYVLNGFWPGIEEELADANLTPVLSNVEQVACWQKIAKKKGHAFPAILQFETGLVRLGLSDDEVRAYAERPDLLEGIKLEALLSHLACAYGPNHPYNYDQRERFKKMCALFPGVRRSLSNSGGLFQGDSYFLDLVRPGRILYGSTFTADRDLYRDVRPVIQLCTRILQIQTVQKGQFVGYDRTFKAPREMRLATLACGYADGFFRTLSNRGWVIIRGIKVPVVGRVSMDLMTVDVTSLSEGELDQGEWAEIIGLHWTVDDLAECAGTVSWEFLTRLGGRVWTHYHRDEKDDQDGY